MKRDYRNFGTNYQLLGTKDYRYSRKHLEGYRLVDSASTLRQRQTKRLINLHVMDSYGSITDQGNQLPEYEHLPWRPIGTAGAALQNLKRFLTSDRSSDISCNLEGFLGGPAVLAQRALVTEPFLPA